jgi:hypothetical protein
MFEQFIELQDRISAIVARSETILNRKDARDVAALGRTRWELAGALREYQLFKHDRIFDPLAQSEGYHARQAQRLRTECIRAGEEFRHYVLEWSAISILDRWDEYKPAALDAIARVRAYIAKDRNQISELLQVKAAA